MSSSEGEQEQEAGATAGVDEAVAKLRQIQGTLTEIDPKSKVGTALNMNVFNV